MGYEEYFVQNQRKNDVKGVFFIKTVRYVYFLAIQGFSYEVISFSERYIKMK